MTTNTSQYSQLVSLALGGEMKPLIDSWNKSINKQRNDWLNDKYWNNIIYLRLAP